MYHHLWLQRFPTAAWKRQQQSAHHSNNSWQYHLPGEISLCPCCSLKFPGCRLYDSWENLVATDDEEYKHSKEPCYQLYSQHQGEPCPSWTFTELCQEIDVIHVVLSNGKLSCHVQWFGLFPFTNELKNVAFQLLFLTLWVSSLQHSIGEKCVLSGTASDVHHPQAGGCQWLRIVTPWTTVLHVLSPSLFLCCAVRRQPAFLCHRCFCIGNVFTKVIHANIDFFLLFDWMKVIIFNTHTFDYYSLLIIFNIVM